MLVSTFHVGEFFSDGVSVLLVKVRLGNTGVFWVVALFYHTKKSPQ
jgi:hypothetical protein